MERVMDNKIIIRKAKREDSITAINRQNQMKKKLMI